MAETTKYAGTLIHEAIHNTDKNIYVTDRGSTSDKQSVLPTITNQVNGNDIANGSESGVTQTDAISGMFDKQTDVESKNEIRVDPASASHIQNSRLAMSRIEESGTWITDLDYVMNPDKKFTLNNLGTHMTARMLSRMTQDKVNKHASIQLGSISGAFDVSGTSRVGIIPEKLMDLYNQYNFKKEYFDKGNVTDFYFGSKLGMNFSKDNVDEFISKYTNQSSSLRLGESNVLNPPFQFNELDDVRSDFRRPKLGRLFCEEVYDYNLPICFFQPGIINIDTATIHLYSGMITKRTMAYQEYLRNEPTSQFKAAINKIGGVLHTGVSWLSKQVMDLGRWYSWTPSVYRYLRLVNEMLEELGVWMGLFRKEFYDSRNVSSMKDTDYESVKTKIKSMGDNLKDKLKTLEESAWFKIQGLKEIASGISKEDIANKLKQGTKSASDAISNAKFSGLSGNLNMLKDVGSRMVDSAKGGITKTVNELELFGTTDNGEDHDTLGSADDDELVGGFPYYMANDEYPDFRLSALNVLPHYQDIKGVMSNTNNDKDDNTSDTSEDILSKTIPFAIDKGATSNETFSNSDQTHPLVEQYNQQYESANQANLIGAGGDLGALAAGSANESLNGDIISQGVGNIARSLGNAIGGIATGTLGNVANYAKNKVLNSFIKSAAEQGLTGEAGMVTTGAGRFVLPNVWSDSSFDKSYSISLKLRCPYGHRLFIYENQLLPLAFLIGLTAPRAVGVQMYTNPFYIKMYCKGLFSVPLGMVTSLSIGHGEGENDRTADGFFRTLSVSMSIKDMLPNLAVGLNAGFTGIMKSANPGMSNYLLTLANIDFVDKAMWEQQYKEVQFNYMGYDTMEDSNIDPKEILSLSQNNGNVKIITAPLDNFAQTNAAGPYVKTSKIDAY